MISMIMMIIWSYDHEKRPVPDRSSGSEYDQGANRREAAALGWFPSKFLGDFHDVEMRYFSIFETDTHTHTHTHTWPLQIIDFGFARSFEEGQAGWFWYRISVLRPSKHEHQPGINMVDNELGMGQSRLIISQVFSVACSSWRRRWVRLQLTQFGIFTPGIFVSCLWYLWTASTSGPRPYFVSPQILAGKYTEVGCVSGVCWSRFRSFRWLADRFDVWFKLSQLSELWISLFFPEKNALCNNKVAGGIAYDSLRLLAIW